MQPFFLKIIEWISSYLFTASRGDSKSPEEAVIASSAKSPHTPDTTTSIDPNEFIKHTFGKSKPDLYKHLEQENEYRKELIDRYHALLREKRELRKRNAQAQTNICQYLRKHSIDLFPPQAAEKSQVFIYINIYEWGN